MLLAGYLVMATLYEDTAAGLAYWELPKNITSSRKTTSTPSVEQRTTETILYTPVVWTDYGPSTLKVPAKTHRNANANTPRNHMQKRDHC